MNKFIADNFNRIFQTEYTENEIEDKKENGSTSEKLIIRTLIDLCYGAENVSFYRLWSILSSDMLIRLADTNHVYNAD